VEEPVEPNQPIPLLMNSLRGVVKDTIGEVTVDTMQQLQKEAEEKERVKQHFLAAAKQCGRKIATLVTRNEGREVDPSL
jgi:16S rRNA U1498 N3-methylase RsmE